MILKREAEWGEFMTVKELKSILNDFDENMEVVTQPSNSRYVDGIRGAKVKGMCSMWGSDRNVVVIASNGQEGAV